MKSIITLLFVLALTLLFSLACYNAPTVPEPDRAADMPTVDVTFQGVTYTVGVADIMASRTAQDIVTPGTDMTPDELRQYFAVEICSSGAFSPWECLIYPLMVEALEGETDFMMTFMVYIMELNGYDVPNGPPPEMDC